MRRVMLRSALAGTATLMMLGAANAQNFGYCFAVENGRAFVSAVEFVMDTAQEIELGPGFLRLASGAGFGSVSRVQCSLGPDREAIESSRRSLVIEHSGALYPVVQLPNLREAGF